MYPVAEFKEFERRFKFKPRLEYGWFHLKLYQMFQDLSRRIGGFKPRLKFFKFHLREEICEIKSGWVTIVGEDTGGHGINIFLR